MDINQCFPSNWLEAADFPDEQVLTIEEVTLEEVGDEKEERPVAWFKGVDKGLILNKTNAGTIADMYGTETDDWAGQKVTLYATETQFGKKMVPCVRIRTRKPVAATGRGKKAVKDEAQDDEQEQQPRRRGRRNGN